MNSKYFRCAGSMIGALGLVACGPMIPGKNLFVIDAEDTPYPVMLSATGPSGGGRPIEASSEVNSEQYRVGNLDIYKGKSSDLSVMEDLARHVQPVPGTWMQIDSAEYLGFDFLGVTSRASSVKVNVNARVRR